MSDMTTGKDSVFPASKHQVSVSITNVGVFIFIGGISKTICPASYAYSLEMVSASEGFTQSLATGIDLQSGFAIDEPLHGSGSGLAPDHEIV